VARRSAGIVAVVQRSLLQTETSRRCRGTSYNGGEDLDI
jgi:hypothetical protein